MRRSSLALPASWAGSPNFLAVPTADPGGELRDALTVRLKVWELRRLPSPDGAAAAVAAARDGGNVLLVTACSPWDDSAGREIAGARQAAGPAAFALHVLEQLPGQDLSTVAETPLDGLRGIMARLLAPDGCPWDREQTHDSLRPYLVEEAAEAIEAIHRGDSAGLADELGDVLLQLAFHAALAEEAGTFDLGDVCSAIEAKMLHRHPHVFGGWLVSGSQEVLRNWDILKADEAMAAGDASPAGPWRQLRKAAVRVSLAALELAFAAAQGRGAAGGPEEIALAGEFAALVHLAAGAGER